MRFAEIFKTELFSKHGQKAGCYINEIYDIINLLSHPIWQQKGGALHGVDNLFFGFGYGKCDRILHLQVVRRKRL